ncbi:hypothetical protein JHD46_01685 [Sulfurimonas sp. SAG-AH-194-C20]|nr:hypothetical protein [Sulfurimonas sp. SAG-AH-194-C20]MDF1878345.1 hypothetical protein [Sulfurimonas sp. SAG-AH-194-C20]
MKKRIIAVVVLLLIIVSLPNIGNSFIQNRVDERLVELESFGLQVSKDVTISNYFKTSRHFEFLLKDPQKFLEYLQKYSDKQFPPYVNAMLEGVLIGTDIKYSNLPFAKSFEIEIYPMQFSQKMNEKLKSFLALKGLLYHIDYNLLNADFKGYIKDIKENFSLQNDTQLNLLLDSAKFSGNGALLAPNELSSKIKELQFELVQEKKSLKVVFHKLKSSTNFESANTYLTNVDVDSMLLLLKGTGDEVNISMDSLRVNASSNDQGESTQLNSKTSLKSLEFTSNQSRFTMKKFNFDVALSGLDKQEYINFAQLVSQNNMKVTGDYSKDLKESMVKLLSKGVFFEVADFSIKEFSKDSAKPIKGFTLKSTLTIKEDAALSHKMKISPFMAIPNISLQSEIRISKELYNKLKKENGMLARFSTYEKEDGDDYVFILKFLDTKASLNGRRLN